MQTKVAAKTTVVLNNNARIIPLKELEKRQIASVSLGVGQAVVFDSILNKYAHISSFSALSSGDNSNPHLNILRQKLTPFNTLIIQVNSAALSNPSTLPFLLENEKKKQVVVVLYGDERQLAQLDTLSAPIIWQPAETSVTANFVAQLVFGGVSSFGKLDHQISPHFVAGAGTTTEVIRLNYSVPEAVGITSDEIERPIDDIVSDAIAERATPGAVVLVAKDGKVIFNKAYGHHTYEQPDRDQVGDIFDLASVTKIAATSMAAMRLSEQQKLSLDSCVGSYIAEAKNTNKQNILVRNLMLHQAGLVPYIPFFETLKPGDCSRDSSDLYCVKVADNCFVRKGFYQDVMWPKMLRSHLQSPGRYVYSDLSMYFMKEIIERVSAEPLADYVQKEFYRPLGMQTAGYNPRNRFPKARIVPTELDNYFRMCLLQGYVHDQGAALAGGVSGHAGLFASANDLAILFQMMLNKGSYGGVQYFNPETVDMFTARQSPVSRRGFGFDRWDPQVTKKYPSAFASPLTYGHTGFTGTCIWVDPKYNLVYIFLSNRVNTTVSNRLASLGIRPHIQDAIYRAIAESEVQPEKFQGLTAK